MSDRIVDSFERISGPTVSEQEHDYIIRADNVEIEKGPLVDHLDPTRDYTFAEMAQGCQSNVERLLQLHEDTCEAARETMRSKNHDYTTGSDNVFANFEGSNFFGVHPGIGIMMRTMDKFKRIETFIRKGTLKVQGEGIDDAIEDAINYMILLKALLREEAEQE